jgi:2-oxoglutarate ferredoxin oxidoreductase subunit alpha
MNLGQLCTLLRAKFLVDAKPVSKVRGQPFTVQEIEEAIYAVAGRHGATPAASAAGAADSSAGG